MGQEGWGAHTGWPGPTRKGLLSQQCETHTRALAVPWPLAAWRVRCAPGGPSPPRAASCCLVLQVMPSEDGDVRVYNVSAGVAASSPLLRGINHMMGGAPPPLHLSSIRGHRSPVGAIALAFDETLATGDCEGQVMLWAREA